MRSLCPDHSDVLAQRGDAGDGKGGGAACVRSGGGAGECADAGGKLQAQEGRRPRESALVNSV
jgi:hypothetical protein